MCRRFAWQELPAVYSAWKRIAKERVRGNQKRDGICHRVQTVDKRHVFKRRHGVFSNTESRREERNALAIRFMF